VDSVSSDVSPGLAAAEKARPEMTWDGTRLEIASHDAHVKSLSSYAGCGMGHSIGPVGFLSDGDAIRDVFSSDVVYVCRDGRRPRAG